MNVRLHILRGIDLHHPINGREVQTASRNISRKEECVRRRGELGIHRKSGGLFLLAMQMEKWNSGMHFAKRLKHEADLLATREEHEYLGL